MPLRLLALLRRQPSGKPQVRRLFDRSGSAGAGSALRSKLREPKNVSRDQFISLERSGIPNPILADLQTGPNIERACKKGREIVSSCVLENIRGSGKW